MAEPTNKTEFINYVLRSLGQPVIQVNISQDQTEDRFTEALQFFQERHYDFNQRYLFAHEVTQAESDAKTFDVDNFGPAIGATGATGEVWPLGTDIVTVEQVFPLGHNNWAGDYMWDLNYQLALQDAYGLYFNLAGYSATPLGYYTSTMSYLQLTQDIFNYPVNFQFSKITRRLTLEQRSKYIDPDKYILVATTVAVDNEKFPAVYRDRMFKQYVKALFKMQWADNIGKFANVPLPGGASINAGAYWEQAAQEKTRIENEINSQYESPPMPFWG